MVIYHGKNRKNSPTKQTKRTCYEPLLSLNKAKLLNPYSTLKTPMISICAMVKSRYIGDKLIPPLIGILIMGPYKPLRNWVDEFIPYYMEIMGV